MNLQPHDVAQLLKSWQLGNDDAPVRLMPLLYPELRQLVRQYIQAGPSDSRAPVIQPIHEAFSRMVNSKVARPDRAHFYAIAARLMRRILVEEGGSHDRNGSSVAHEATISAADDLPRESGAALAALDRALERFAQVYPRESDVVELKFFGGLKMRDISEVLNVSETTVLRDWNFARLWLYRELRENAE